MAKTSYAVALGSNRPHGTHGSPVRILRAAAEALDSDGVTLARLSTIRTTPAMGPAGRGFANAVAIVETEFAPPELLARLKKLERGFGRRKGRRWGPRVLDLDIILWSGGCWGSPSLIVPHPAFRDRGFVLEPLAEIAPAWPDQVTGLTARQLVFRQSRRRPVDPAPLRT